MQESSIAALFMLLGVIFGCGAFIAGFVAFFAKSRTREIAINVVLILATLPLVLAVSLFFVSKRQAVKQYMEFSVDEDPIKFCLNIATALPVAADRNPIVKQVSNLGSPIPSRKALMNASLLKLKQLLAEHPDNEFLAARYMLVGAMSDDPRAGRNEALYWATKLPDSKIVKVVFNLLCNKDPIDSATARQNKKQILKSLPPGWYQQNALMLNEKAAGHNEEYEKNAKAKQDVAEAASASFFGVILATLVIDVLGFVFLFKAMLMGNKLIPEKDNFHPPGLTFRSVYAVFLSSFWGLFFTLLAVFFAGEISGTNDLLPQILLPSCAVGRFVAVFAAFYFFVLAPRSLNFSSANEYLSFNITAANWSKYLLTGFAAFCVMVLFLTAWQLAVAQFVGADVQTLLTGAFLDWVVAPSILSDIAHFVAGCLMAPVDNQVLFRALFYGWLRKHFKILPAILISALINTSLTDVISTSITSGIENYIPIIVFSAIYAIVFERTRSIVPAIIAQVFLNTSILILALAFAYTGIR